MAAVSLPSKAIVKMCDMPDGMLEGARGLLAAFLRTARRAPAANALAARAGLWRTLSDPRLTHTLAPSHPRAPLAFLRVSHDARCCCCC